MTFFTTCKTHSSASHNSNKQHRPMIAQIIQNQHRTNENIYDHDGILKHYIKILQKLTLGFTRQKTYKFQKMTHKKLNTII